MNRINWGRVVLGGMLAAAVLMVFATASTVLIAGRQGLRTSMHALQPSTRGGLAPLFFILAFLFLGILMTWWYAVIRSLFGPGPKAAAIAGFAMWLTVIAFTLKSVAVGEPVPLPEGPISTILYLLMMIASTTAGAWVYKEQQR